MSDASAAPADALLKDLLELPVDAHKSNYVISLTHSIGRAHETLERYVVTPQLQGVFESALSLVCNAVERNSSAGAWLHSSFGGGKSHFMSVLGLVLEGEPETRNKPGLADAIDKFDDRLAGRKFFVLPLNMISKANVEAAVLGGYAKLVRERHPGCAVPAVYLAEALFDDARNLRNDMGDERFFHRLNESSSSGDGGWGKLAAGWDGPSFDAALGAEPESTERRKLIGDLVATYFSATGAAASSTGEGMVDLDTGLGVISQHAKDLGYDGIVLMLDEVVLWFATLMADQAFVNSEGPKVAKLVESGTVARPAPIITFLARQKDLRDLVGEEVSHAEQLNISTILSWWEGRFDTFDLEMDNLRQIVQKRLLSPKSGAAASVLDAAFAATTGRAGERIVDTLCNDDADRAEFRRIYPFSPALLSAVVDLGAVLQRDRTALRVLAQLLVDRRDSMRVGDLVPVGDLYDVIASGDEPFGSQIRDYWRQAGALYRDKLRPMLLAQHSLTEAQATDLANGDRSHPFCTDDRLIKTLLVAAIVPGSRALGSLTPSRLAALNHGTLKSPIPGQERSLVLAKLQRWKSEVGEISLDGDPDDPVVSLHLVGIDTEGVLRSAAAADSAGARRRELRALLSTALGLEDPNSMMPTRTVLWKGTRRPVDVRFGNLADHTDLAEDELIADGRPRIVIDFPMEENGFKVNDDLARIESFIASRPPTNTICWVPNFLSQRTLADLGNYVIINHVLNGDNFTRHASHLSVIDRPMAKQLLISRREGLLDRLGAALRQAYRVDEPIEGTVDAELAAEKQFQSLDSTFTPRRPTASSLMDAFDKLVGQMLTHLHPAHPNFEEEVKVAGLRAVLAEILRAAELRTARLEVPPGPNRQLMRRIANPLQLGTMYEGHYEPSSYWNDTLERKLAAERPAVLTVGLLRSWLDQPDSRGLTRDVQDLVILALAATTDRVLTRAGAPVKADIGRLDDDLELHTQQLPDSTAWSAAVAMAAAVFGIAASPAVTAAAVAKLVNDVRTKATESRLAVTDLDGVLGTKLTERGLPPEADRLRTSRASKALLDAISTTGDDAKLVQLLATTAPPTSAAAMAASISKAAAVRHAIANANWDLLKAASALGGELAASAAGLHEAINTALTNDQFHTELVAELERLERQATELVAKATAAPPVAPGPAPEPSPSPANDPVAPSHQEAVVETAAHVRVAPADALSVLDELRAVIERTNDDGAADVTVDITWTVRKSVQQP